MSITPTRPTVRRLRRGLAAVAAAAGLAAGLITGTLAAAGPAAAATYVQGFDVSHYQGSIDWGAQYAAGARFAYIKATEGTSYVDSSFDANYTGAYDAGFIRGAYHFAHPDSSAGATQADYFIAHGGGWSGDGKTLPPMLDIEYNPSGSTCYGLSQASMVSWINSFNTEMHSRTGKYPMIYTTLDWWTQCTGNSSAFASTNPFNLAKYSSTEPTPPAGTGYWTMWQYADSGTFPGDQDYFNGTYANLQALATNND